jgi:hypothetical protein
MKTHVNVGYPSEHFNDPDETLEYMAEQFGGKRNGSGCGFGQRDMHFDFPDKKSAQKFIKECKAYKWNFKIIAEIQKD